MQDPLLALPFFWVCSMHCHKTKLGYLWCLMAIRRFEEFLLKLQVKGCDAWGNAGFKRFLFSKPLRTVLCTCYATQKEPIVLFASQQAFDVLLNILKGALLTSEFIFWMHFAEVEFSYNSLGNFRCWVFRMENIFDWLENCGNYHVHLY